MPDPVPNPDASVVVTPPPGPQPPQVQSPQGTPDQIPQGPGPQQFQPPTQTPQPGPWHRAVQALLGSTTEYQQTPNGPVPYQVPNKPGNLFRSILAGAILGAGAGASGSQNDAGSGWSAAGRGAAAAQQGMQQQQQQRAAEAQKQWENQRQANQDTQEDLVRKAQIAMYNMTKLKDMAAIQGGDYTTHKEMIDDAKPKVASYDATGLKPVKEGVSETEYEKLKDTPGWSTYDWQPVGMTHYVDAKTGLVNYQTVWNAYDPQGGKITITPALWSQWKDNGLLDREPNLAGVLHPDQSGNRSIPYSAFMTYDAESSKLKADTKAKAAADFETKKNNAELEHLAAQTLQEKATAAASGDEAALRSYELKQEKLATDAETALTQNGNDWSKLKPAQKVALQPQVQKDIEGYRTELSDPLLKEQLSSNDPDIVKAAQERAADLQTKLDDARSHSIFVPPSGGAGGSNTASSDPAVVAAIGRLKGLPPAQVETALANPNITPAQKDAIRKGLGITIPNPSQPIIDRIKTLSPHDREMALADPNISLRDEDGIRRSLGVNVPDDSKYDKDVEVQKQIKKMKGVSPELIENRLSDYDFTPGQLEAIARGVKREELAPNK